MSLTSYRTAPPRAMVAYARRPARVDQGARKTINARTEPRAGRILAFAPGSARVRGGNFPGAGDIAIAVTNRRKALEAVARVRPLALGSAPSFRS